MTCLITWFKVGSLVNFTCVFFGSSVSDSDNDDEGLTRVGDVTMVGEIWSYGRCC